MIPAISLNGALRYSRNAATRAQLEAACKALAADEYSDHHIAAMLALDVASVRRAIARGHHREERQG